MSESDEWQPRFDELAAALADDQLTDAMSDELVAMLAKYPEAHRRLAEHQLMLAQLRDELPAAMLKPPRRDKIRSRVAAVVLATALLACFAVAWQYRPTQQTIAKAALRNDGTISSSAETPLDSGVAVLTHQIDATWLSTESIDVGNSLPPGSFELDSGVIQLEFYRGAVVVIEGPAHFDLVNAERMTCQRGKLRARVPPPANGFTIETSQFELVDRGTEFGLNIAADGTENVDVFEGQVELFDLNSNRSPDSRRRVDAKESVSISRDGTESTNETLDVAYISADNVQELAQRQSATRYKAWKTASSKLSTDPNVIARFGFVRDDASDRQILIDGLTDEGAVVGARWTEGRWPQKTALEFKRPGDRVRAHIDGEFDSVTFSTWVRIDALDRPFSALILTNGYEEGEPHWQIRSDGRLLLGLKTPQGHVAYDSEPVLGLRHIGQWTHLATVYDGGNESVTHYINGRPAGSQPLTTSRFSLRFGDVEIGNWGAPVQYSPQKVRNFNGRIDELTLHRVPFTAKEVQAMFESGKP